MDRASQFLTSAGEVFGDRYEVLYRLDAGATGQVCAARDRVTEEVVALKIVSLDETGGEPLRERFEAEVAVASSLEHPHAVRVLGHGVQGNQAFLVMELLRGQPLSELVAVGPQSAAFTVHVAKQACAALGEAHRLGLVHRDVKPGNLVLCPTPEDPSFVKLIDFGLAGSAAQRLPGEVEPGSSPVEGTPHFVAPEQIRGQPVDGRADIYGLGATMYALLVGAPPFGAGPGRDVLRRQLGEDGRRPPSRADDPRSATPEALADLVARCTKLDRTARPPSMQALMGELLACEAELVGHPRPRTQPLRGQSSASASGRSRPPDDEIEESPRLVARLTLVIAVVSVLAVVGIGYSVLQPEAKPGRSAPAASELEPRPSPAGVSASPIAPEPARPSPAPVPQEARAASAEGGAARPPVAERTKRRADADDRATAAPSEPRGEPPPADEPPVDGPAAVAAREPAVVTPPADDDWLLDEAAELLDPFDSPSVEEAP